MTYLIVLMGFWAGKASAETGRPMPPPPPPRPLGTMEGRAYPGMMADFEPPLWRHLRELGLDEKQLNAVRVIQNRARKEMIRKWADMQIAGMELKELLDKDPVDLKAVELNLKKLKGKKPKCPFLSSRPWKKQKQN